MTKQKRIIAMLCQLQSMRLPVDSDNRRSVNTVRRRLWLKFLEQRKEMK